MPSKNPNEKLKELDEKIKQLQAQKQQFINKVKEEERKKRTRNLIQIGGIMDTIGMKNIKQANAFKERLSSKPEFLSWFNSIMKEFEEVKATDSETKNNDLANS